MRDTITLTNGEEVGTGTWLEGAHGWTNSYRVIDIAEGHGFTMDADERAALDWYRASGESDASGSDEELDMLEIVTGQRGLSDRATDHMEELLPGGWTLHWDAGELSLLPDWSVCAGEGNGCQVGVDDRGNEIVVKRCFDHNPCEGHNGEDSDLLNPNVNIGETTYCDGSCVQR